MAEFKVGDYVIFNKRGCFALSCLEYHAVVTEELRKNRYMLHILDEYIRSVDHKFGVDRDFKCSGRYMVAQFASTDCPFRMSGADSSVETV